MKKSKSKKIIEVKRTKEDNFMFVLLAILTVVAYLSSFDLLSLNDLVVDSDAIHEERTLSKPIGDEADVPVFNKFHEDGKSGLKRVTPDEYFSLWEELNG